MPTTWITRHGTTLRSFRYRKPDGTAVSDEATLARIRALAIPPAWKEVHIATGARAAVQAWGYDARGRKQYRYHARARERGALRKYYRVRELARDLPGIRQRLDAAIREPEPSRDRTAAAVVRLISQGFFRVGNERYLRENKTFGITTLAKRHLTVDGDTIIFAYRGKSGRQQRQVVVDGTMAQWLEKEAMSTPGARLFRYREDGRWRNLTASDVNRYLRESLRVPYSAKDFRTWGGTLRAATVLAELGAASSATQATRNVNTALRLVSAELGNTPAICRASYVHPIVLARYVDEGETIALPDAAPPAGRRSRSRRGRRHAHAPEERALIRFLDRHFPERRNGAASRKPRAGGERRR